MGDMKSLNLRGAVTRSVKGQAMKPLPTAVCRCAMPGKYSSILWTSLLSLYHCQPATTALQLPNCAAGSMWVSKQGFLETGLGMLMDTVTRAPVGHLSQQSCWSSAAAATTATSIA